MVDKLLMKGIHNLTRYAPRIELFLWSFSIVTVIFSLGHLAYRLPLWTDELAVVTFINKISYKDFIIYWPGFTNLPVYYLLMKFYASLTPAKEIVLRLPSLLFFSLSFLYLWRFTRKLSLTKTFAVPVCLSIYFMYSNPMFFFAHEVRPYALQVFLVMAHLYYSYLILWQGVTRKRYYYILTLLSPLTLLTHYYGALYICANLFFSLILLWRSVGKSRSVLYYNLSHVLCLIPFVYGAPGVVRAFFESRPFWIESLTPSSVVNHIGLALSDKGWPAISILLSPLFLYAVLKGMKRIPSEGAPLFKTIGYYFGLLLSMLFVIMVKSQVGTSVFHYRYLAIWLPIFLLCTGLALSVIEKYIHRLLLTFLTILIFIIHWSSIDSKYLLDIYPANDVRGAIHYIDDYVETVKNQVRSKSITLHTSLWNPEFYHYYLEQFPQLKSIMGREIWVYKQEMLTPVKRKEWYPVQHGDQVIFVCFEDFFCQSLHQDFETFQLSVVVEKDFSGIKVLIGEKK